MASFLLQVSILYLAARLGAAAARRVGLPAVVGELCIGILMGPSILGALSQTAASLLSGGHTGSGAPLNTILRFGLAAFLFSMGLDMRWDRAASNSRRAVLLTSALGVALPLASGMGLVILFPVLFSHGSDRHPLLPFLVGVALSITALPVILRILDERRLTTHRVGSVVIASALVDDFLGWALFAILILLKGGGVLWTEAILLVFPLGAALSGPLRRSRLTNAVRSAGAVIVPLYFVSLGLKADFVLELDLFQVLAVTVTACAGKMTGAFAGARLGGIPRKEACAIAVAMNARGAVEMILAAIALETSLIDRPLYVSLVLMALTTTALAGFLLKAPRDSVEQPQASPPSSATTAVVP